MESVTIIKRLILLIQFLTVSVTSNLNVNINFLKIKVTVRLNLKKLNYNYPSCHLVGRHLTFPVTTRRYIPWVEFVFPALIFDRL
jgi:hypothetical protein